MCILILLRDLDARHGLVVASNRDERRDRPAAPPGLWVGARHRLLSPRDRRAGGTWLAVDEHGRVAGITNLAGVPPVAGAPSRGHLPHLVLDEQDLAAGITRVREEVRTHRFAGFQLVVADARETFVLCHRDGELVVRPWSRPVLVVTNEHAPGELWPFGLDSALAPELTLERRFDLLAAVLRDPGGDGRHAVLKLGDDYGTVSSSLLAVPRDDATQLTWRYAPGSPDVTAYRNYGNLGRRLLPDT
ncbi:MAG: NRDE family protein [Planctomycetes bacterium]|nr:NRDE family protein [Planctomycetota bacterium]